MLGFEDMPYDYLLGRYALYKEKVYLIVEVHEGFVKLLDCDNKFKRVSITLVTLTKHRPACLVHHLGYMYLVTQKHKIISLASCTDMIVDCRHGLKKEILAKANWRIK